MDQFQRCARITALLAAALWPATQSRAADPGIEVGRAQMLYENHCLSCHETTIHLRPLRAATRDEVQVQVNRWQGVLELGWPRDDIESVTRYLATKYYGIGTSE